MQFDWQHQNLLLATVQFMASNSIEFDLQMRLFLLCFFWKQKLGYKIMWTVKAHRHHYSALCTHSAELCQWAKHFETSQTHARTPSHSHSHSHTNLNRQKQRTTNGWISVFWIFFTALEIEIGTVRCESGWVGQRERERERDREKGRVGKKFMCLVTLANAVQCHIVHNYKSIFKIAFVLYH